MEESFAADEQLKRVELGTLSVPGHHMFGSVFHRGVPRHSCRGDRRTPQAHSGHLCMVLREGESEGDVAGQGVG